MSGLCRGNWRRGSCRHRLDQAWNADEGDGSPEIVGERGQAELAAHILQPDTRGAVIDMLAAFLRRLHAIPIAECPFNNDHALRLSRARARIDAGLVDVEDIDEERQGWSAEQLWAAMQALLPIAPDPVVTHGDFSLDNILIHQGRVVGCIDLGRVGIAERYQDLAILWNCLGEFDPLLRNRFFRAYGIASPDLGKLRFHLMLDELF